MRRLARAARGSTTVGICQRHRTPIAAAGLAAALSLLLLIAAGTPPGYPVNDSAAYHRMVEMWSDTGHPVFIGWNEMTLLGHLAVGVAADRVGAGSIRALQLLAGIAAALIAAMVTVVPARRGLAGASAVLLGLCWMANPLVLVSATSFMTEIPETLWAVVWLVACAIWLRRGGIGSASVWVVAAVLAFSVRQTAVALPVAALFAGLVFRKRLSSMLLASLTLAIDAMLWFYRAELPLATVRPISDHWGAAGLPGLLLQTASHQAQALTTLGILLIPLAACVALNRRLTAVNRWGIVVGGGVSVCLAATQSVFPFWHNIMATTGLLTDTLPPHDPLPLVLPDWSRVLATVFGVLSLAVLVSTNWRGRFRQEPAILLSGLALTAYVTLASISAAPFDRYLVPSLVFAVLAVVSAEAPAALRWRPVAVVVLLGCAGLSASSVQGLHHRQQDVWQIATSLVTGGVNPQRIDAGLEWNMWHQPTPFRRKNSRLDHSSLWWYEAYPFTEMNPARRMWIGVPPEGWCAIEAHVLPSGHEVLVLAPANEEEPD